MVKFLAHAHRHIPMRMHGNAMLLFAEKAGDERPENEPLWQPKIVYPPNLMDQAHPLTH